MSQDLFDILITELDEILEPLVSAVEDPYWLDRILTELGVAAEYDGNSLVTALQQVLNLKTQLTSFSEKDSPSLTDISNLLDSASAAFTSVRTLSDSGQVANQFTDLGKDLVEWLIIVHLVREHPIIFHLGVLLTVIEQQEDSVPVTPVVKDGVTQREAVSLRRLHPKKLIDLVRDPEAMFRAEYLNDLNTVADANAMADKFFRRLARLLSVIGIHWKYGLDAVNAAVLGDAGQIVDHSMMIYFDQQSTGGVVDAGITLSFSSKESGDLGLVVAPFGGVSLKKQFDDWTTEFDLTAEIEAFAYGRHGATITASIANVQVDGKLSATLAAPDDGPAVVLGSPAGTRLEVGGAQLSLATSLSEKQQSFDVSALVSSSQVVVAKGDSDSFLASFLPSDGLAAKFDLGIEWSNVQGLTFHGTAGLDADIPVGLSLAQTLSVPTVHLGLKASDSGLTAEVSAALVITIGPVLATVDRIGLLSTLSFPDNGGNLGVADLDLSFKPPSGAGIRVQSAVVTGGGFLSFDFDKGQYSGVLALTIENITITAVGLINTKLPGGASGFSFIVILTAEGFKPIPVGLGFTLTGIGGLLAINRTCNDDFLREGLKTNSLANLLFPKDPIRNAAQILGLLSNAFPPQTGSFLFGPAVQICWGTPVLLTMDLALVMELGQRTRLIIMGRVASILPTEKNDLIRLQLNALGVIDFDQSSISLDATLFDSRLVGKFPITGGMAMRLNWGSAPVFALSVGGFHPAFKPPANFPVPDRLAISFSNSDDLKLRAECYYALTSNTLQWGAKAQLTASSGGFSIDGHIGYDVLIQFDPFSFVADFSASVQLKYHSSNLFKVSVDGELSGPQPLHVKGKATFEIFWCDFSVGFDRTLVDGAAPPKLAPVNVNDLLVAALSDDRNWAAQLSDKDRRMVTFVDAPASGLIRIHPLGQVSIKQKVVPLDLKISRFGNTVPSSANTFTISSVTIGGRNVSLQPAMDFFAPSQFLDLSDDEKLAAPSFESMKAGIALGTPGYLTATNDLDIIVEPIEYETILVDKANPGDDVPPVKVPISISVLESHLSFGAAARSVLRTTGKAKYAPAAAKNGLVSKGWTIASTTDGSMQGVPDLKAGTIVSYSQSFQALQAARAIDPAAGAKLMLVRVSKN